MTDPSGTPAPDAAASLTSKRRSRGVKIFLRDVVLIILAAILISFLIKTFLIRSFYIPSDSMNNTLLKNDRIIVNELQPKVFGLQRGDVVVFTDPGGWLGDLPVDTRSDAQKVIDNVLGFVGLAAPDSNNHLIKRVIGLPGDHVTCCNDFGQIEVNGVPLDEPYIVVPSGDKDSAPSSFDITVPAGDLWVMGDNRYESADSLNHINDPGHGYLPVADVVGRAFVITWPASRWTWLSDYPDTFGTVPEPTVAPTPAPTTTSGQ